MEVAEFIYQSNTLTTKDELQDCFVRYISSLGFERFMMGEVSPALMGNVPQTPGLMVNYPQEWMGRYFDQKYALHDPVYLRTMKSTGAFSWATALEEDSNPLAQRIMDEAGDFGLQAGVGCSLVMPDGRKIGFGFSSSYPDARVDQPVQSLLHVASFQFHNVLSFVSQTQTVSLVPTLTTREKEVLLWVACGKSKSEVAVIMVISESAVKRHCESIFKKLKTNNLVASVVKAMKLGLINP